MLDMRVTVGSEQKFVTSDKAAKTRQSSVWTRSWFLDTVVRPRGTPKSCKWMGESAQKKSPIGTGHLAAEPRFSYLGG